MGHIKVARWTYYTGNLSMGNFQKQTFMECDRPERDKLQKSKARLVAPKASFTFLC
jgi:hypothetical protein